MFCFYYSLLSGSKLSSEYMQNNSFYQSIESVKILVPIHPNEIDYNYRLENPDSESKDDKMKISAFPMNFEKHLEIFGLLLDIHNNKIPPNVKIRKYDENTSIIIRDKTITRKRSDSCKITKSHSIDKYDNNKDKLVFWLSDNNYHVENKIQEELLTLLKQIFDKRYQIYPNNVCSLSK